MTDETMTLFYKDRADWISRKLGRLYRLKFGRSGSSIGQAAAAATELFAMNISAGDRTAKAKRKTSLPLAKYEKPAQSSIHVAPPQARTGFWDWWSESPYDIRNKPHRQKDDGSCWQP